VGRDSTADDGNHARAEERDAEHHPRDLAAPVSAPRPARARRERADHNQEAQTDADKATVAESATVTTLRH